MLTESETYNSAVRSLFHIKTQRVVPGPTGLLVMLPLSAVSGVLDTGLHVL